MKVSFAASILLFILFYNITQAQWVQTNGPFCGDKIGLIGVNNNNLIIGSDSRLFLSTNNSSSWSSITNDFSGIYPTGVTFSGNAIYISTFDLGIYKSTNMGLNWIHLNSPDSVFDITSIGNIIYAASNGIYSSSDAGLSWQIISSNSTISNNPVWTLASYNNSLFEGTMGIQKTTNNGINWSQVFTNPSQIFSKVIVNGNYIFGAIPGVNNGVYATTNNGVNWTINNGIINNAGISDLAFSNGILYTEYYTDAPFLPNYLKYSTDNGITFLPVGTGLPLAYFNTLFSQGNNVYVGTDAGIFQSSNSGFTWTANNNGIRGHVNCMADNNGTILAGAYGVYLSMDEGNNWLNIGLSTLKISSIACLNNKIFAASDSGIFISSNNGANWIFSSPIHNVSDFLVDGNNLFVCALGYGINLTTDDGITWTPRNNGFLYLNNSKMTKISNELFCGTADGNYNHDRLYFSTNYGQNWQQTNFDQSWISSISTSGTNILVGTNLGIYVSTSGGLNWQILTQSIKYANTIISIGNVIFVSSGYVTPGVYFSSDNGITWNAFNEGLTDLNVTSMVDVGTKMFASNQTESVLKRDISSVTNILKRNSNIPKTFILSQNYPNPFNPSTTINYQLPKSSNVELVVYDIMGQKVKTPVNEKQNVGSYQIQFDGSNFASGVYFYKLQSGNFEETKKMSLIK